jgi:ComF family protein
MGLLDLLYPDRCAACDALDPDRVGLCAPCADSLYPITEACPVCAQPQQRSVLCRRCARRPPPFRRVVAPYRYGGELAVALRRFKWGGSGGAGRAELARALGALLAPALSKVTADVIVPVPLHARRLRERGFSQASLLAASARQWARVRAPVRAGALRRVRATDEQAGLLRSARMKNVAGAFAARRVAGLHVLVVDDVVTTGATATACARALRRAGAASVTVLALARAEA